MMGNVVLNESGHWQIVDSSEELHSGDFVRVLRNGEWTPGRIELDTELGVYVVIVDGGQSFITITAEMQILLPNYD